MELTGVNLLLILFAPLGVIFVLVLLLYPLQARLFDREKPLKKQLKDKRQEFKEELKEKQQEFFKNTIEQGERPSKAQLEEFRGEIKELGKDYLHNSWATTKEIIKVHNEESGFSDTVEELKKDLKVDGGTSAFLYLGSMLLTPVALFFFAVSGLGTLFFRLFGTESHGHQPFEYLLYLIFPAFGIWLAYRGYAGYQKKAALNICLLINAVYALFLIYSVLTI